MSDTVIGMQAVKADAYNTFVDRAMWVREMYTQGYFLTAKRMLVDILTNYNEVVAQGFGQPEVANVIAVSARIVMGQDASAKR